MDIMGVKICFLDCDGVLNCQSSTSRFDMYIGCDDDKLERLKKIVDQTGALIVVSSTWRLDISRGNGNFLASGIYAYLLENLKRYGLFVYDITPELSKKGSYRGKEIMAWLNDHQDLDITGWVVLDDEWFCDFYQLADHLVQTSFYMDNGGLQDEDVERAIYVLNGGISNEFTKGD